MTFRKGPRPDDPIAFNDPNLEPFHGLPIATTHTGNIIWLTSFFRDSMSYWVVMAICSITWSSRRRGSYCLLSATRLWMPPLAEQSISPR
jgi:hypothetical protein